MDTLLCILLYLEVLCTPCTYYDYEIIEFRTIHAIEIEVVESDEVLLEWVLFNFIDDTNQLVILDSGAVW